MAQRTDWSQHFSEHYEIAQCPDWSRHFFTMPLVTDATPRGSLLTYQVWFERTCMASVYLQGEYGEALRQRLRGDGSRGYLSSSSFKARAVKIPKSGHIY